MTIPDGTILQMVTNLLLPSSVIAQNVFHLRIDVSGSPAADQDVIDDLSAYSDVIYGSWRSIGDSNISIGAIDISKRDVAGGDWDPVGTGTSALVGLVAGEMLPHAVAGYTRAISTSPEVTAKKFWPGITEASQAEGVWAGATIAQMVDMNDKWVTPFVGAVSGEDYVPGCWSPKNLAFFAFTGTHITSAIPAYQRRRKPGVGI